MNAMFQKLTKFISLKLSTVSFKLTSKGMNSIPKPFTFSFDTLYFGWIRGLLLEHLQHSKQYQKRKEENRGKSENADIGLNSSKGGSLLCKVTKVHLAFWWIRVQ